MNIQNIVLASASPRRKELLLQIGIRPEIQVSQVEEQVTSRVPSQVVMELASQKAWDVAVTRSAGTLVIGSDTVVAVDGRILGKPKSHEEAYEMVRSLAGRSHQVYTGVCMVLRTGAGEEDRALTFFDETEVEVYPMTEEELRNYSQSEEPMDKAGAYAVQGLFARYIKGLKGSYANVMGLPVSLVYQGIRQLTEPETKAGNCQE